MCPSPLPPCLPQRLRVAVLITLPELGGAQTHVRELLASLDPARFELHLLTAGTGWLTEQAEALGVQVHPLRRLRRSLHPWHDAAAFAELIGLLRRLRPDILHLHSSKAGILGRLAAPLAGVRRVFFTAHGFSFHEQLAPWALTAAVALERILAPFCEAIVPVSEYDRARALRFGVGKPERLRVIYNGIETALYPRAGREETRAALGLGPGAIAIGMVARFAPQKDHGLLLRAIAPLLAQTPQLQLLLVGTGPLWQQTQALAQELGLGERVRFLGDRTDVPALLSAFDLFVLASRYEGLPITIIEAMAAGLPVVASDVGGIREQISDLETGLLVSAHDETALREALARLVGDPTLRDRLGAAAQERARARFDVRQMGAAIAELYAEQAWSKPSDALASRLAGIEAPPEASRPLSPR